jgi:hypothetical protein
MNKLIILAAAILATPLSAETFPEMGIAPGYYTYKGACSETFDPQGNIGQMSFLFDGGNLNTANSSCKISSVDFISAGYLNAQTNCVYSETGKKTQETYTLLPDQDGQSRIKLYATYVKGRRAERNGIPS